MEPQVLHDTIHALLREVSAKVILPRFRSLVVEEIFAKSSAEDVVTVADREAEVLLAEGLRKIADIPVVGEEGAYADPALLDHLTGDCWIVDPVDGTRNFAKGEPPFGILLALSAGGVAHTGWIYDVLSDRFCVAHGGKGAFVNGEKIAARETGELPPIAAISPMFSSQQARGEAMARIGAEFRLVDIPWCAAEQYPRLALGVNDVAIFGHTHPWDHAAGVLWLNEAGGKAARPDGSAYRVDQGSEHALLVASSPAMWDRLAGLLG